MSDDDRPAPTDLAERGPRQRGGVLGQHDFRLLWIGETTSALGTNITRLALPLVAVLTLDATAFQVSLLTALAWVPWLVVGLPAGAWVDRLPRRPAMLVSDAVSMVALLSVPVAAWAGVLTLAQLLGTAVVVGAAGVFFQTAYQVYLPGLVDADDLPQANATLHGSESAAEIAGPGLAGLIAQALGAVAGLVADAASFAVSAVCLLRIRTPERGAPDPDPASSDGKATNTGDGLVAQISAGLRFLARDPYLRVLTVFGALSNFALIGYQSILVVFLIRDVGADPAVVGLLLAGMSVGGLLGAVLAPTLGRRVGTARGTLIAELAAAPFALLIPLTAPGPRLLLVVAGGVGVGVTVVAANVLKTSFRQAYVPRQILGRVIVGMQFLNYGTIPLGALTAGALATTLGLRPTLWLMTAGVGLATLSLLIGPLKHHRDFPTHPEHTAAS